MTVNVVDWSHDELEIEDGLESIGTRFANRTYILRAEVEQQQTERLSGKLGVWTQAREFEAVGEEALAPRTDQASFAAFAYEELNIGRIRLQFGGRLEQNHYQTAERTGGHGSEEEEDHHGDEEEEEFEAPDLRDRQFRGASASVGLHAALGADSAFVANLTQSHRAPALEELYNFGPHVGNLAFEVGNPELDGETTLGLDLSLRHQTSRVQSNLNVYVYDIDNFVFGDRTDEVADNLPVLNFIQADSRFVGFDAKGSVRLGGRAWATLGIGLVDARLTSTNDPLPRIPPLRGTLSFEIPSGGFTISPELEFGGAPGRRVSRRDHDCRLLRREPACIVCLAPATRGACPDVLGVQPDERALSEPHLVHQGPGARDGPRGDGGLLGAVLLAACGRTLEAPGAAAFGLLTSCARRSGGEAIPAVGRWRWAWRRPCRVEAVRPVRTRGASWTAPRTPEGQPDLAGVWTNPTITPFERGTNFSYSGVAVPESAAGRAFFTAEEEARFAALTAADREASLGYVNRSLDAGTRLLSTLQTSLVVESGGWTGAGAGVGPNRPRDSNRAREREDYRHMSVWGPVSHARGARFDVPGRLQQRVSVRADAGRRRDPLRDDP